MTTVEHPPGVEVRPSESTAIPRTYFFQQPWVLFGVVDPVDRPTAADLACETTGDLDIPEQPVDLTVYGSRVVGGASVSPLLVLSDAGAAAALRCAAAQPYEPLYVVAASPAPTLVPTGIIIAGAVIIAVGMAVRPTKSHQTLWTRLFQRTWPGRKPRPGQSAKGKLIS